MDKFKKGGNKFNSNLAATNRLFAKNPLLKKRRKKAPGIYDPNAKYKFPDGGITTQQEIDAANTAMMKAKLAYADMHGNPAAKRMIVAPDQPYDFGNGITGTHYMASMDNYAVPQIQDINGQLMLGDYGPQSTEAIRFDGPADAEYFAEHYKDVSPAFLNEKEKGGALLTKKVTCKKCGWKWDAADGGDDITTCHKCGGQGLVHTKNGGAYYDDSRDAWVSADGTVGPNGPAYAEGGEYFELDLTPEEIDEYKKGGFIVEDISVPSLNQMEEGGAYKCPPGYIKVVGFDKCVPVQEALGRNMKPYITNNPNDPRIKAFSDSLHLYNQTLANNRSLHGKKMISQLTPVPTNEFQKKVYKKSKIKPIGFMKGYRTSKTPASMKSTEFPVYPMPRQEVIYKPKTKQSKKLITKKVEEKPIVKEEVIAEEPMQMMPILPVTKVDPTLQKFIGTVPEIKEEETFPDAEVSEEVDYTEGGTDAIGADWKGRTERYIDWDGNSIGYNGVRFRKPGHGGDLIKKGRRHYLHYPSIETRYQAELVPEEEEYAMGGEYNIGDEVELTEAEVKRLRSLGYIIEEA